ncbi:hypothetical protein CAS74_000174 [Pichia kudriavzevii]|uniref:N-acetyltransferase domain-containing protein n=1 Tax=Pichia kudriavzevii TaxID=4909 RepID=A0A1Z8JT87_PICKU|nr:hypothetical protein CAS74_000174 [Pichia kudriavzevii]
MCTFEETTDRPTIEACQAANYKTWGQPFTLKQYQYRDWLNYSTDYDKLGVNDHYFILKNDKGAVVSACEVIMRDSVVKTKDGLQKARTGTIGSVYTPHEYRGQGYASKLLTELSKHLDTKYLSNEWDCCLLYSEIGDYYSKWGWIDHSVKVRDLSCTNYIYTGTYENVVEIKNDFREVVEDFQKLLVEDLSQTEEPAFVVVPTEGLYGWWTNRVRVSYWATHEPDGEEPKDSLRKDSVLYPITMGFKFIDDTDKLNYIVVSPLFHKLECSILVLVSYGKKQEETLLSLVSSKCKEWGIPKLHVWEGTLKYITPTEPLTKNGSLSYVRFRGGKHVDAKWVGNGEWVWF